MQTNIAQCFSPKSSINQMHLSMFNTSTIEIYIHPMVCNIFIERKIGLHGVSISKEIPRRINERIHGISLSSCWFTTLWAINIAE